MPDNFRMKKSSLFIPPRRPDAAQPLRHGWGAMLWTGFRRLLMVFGAIFLGTALLVMFASVAVLKGVHQESLPGNIVLEMTLDGDYPEYELVSNPLAGGGPTMLQVVNALDHASRDKRVKGIVVDLESSSMTLGHIEEFRAALIRFRKANKFAYIYGPEYGDPGRGLGTYYLVSAFGQIWMQPVGALSIAGISAEMPFARGLLDKVGVQPEFFQRKEYKSLFESFENKEMSPASREEMSSLLQDLGGQLIDGIAQARGMTPAAVRAVVDKGMYTDKEALAAGLVTRLDSYDVLKDQVREEVTGKKAPAKPGLAKIAAKKNIKKDVHDGLFVDIDRYVLDNKNDPGQTVAGLSGHKKRVALVYITGTITAQPSTHTNAFGGSPSGENITDDLLAIADDPDVDIVVLRIDSPGGSP